jgi:hypothetical protein
VLKRIKALTQSTISGLLMLVSCDTSTEYSEVCGIQEAAVPAFFEAKMSECG